MIHTLNVVPGLLCDMECPHCATSSGPSARGGMRPEEVARVASALRSLAPRWLVFTGGEPTLYLGVVDAILAAHPDLGGCSVQLTTNGWFARSPATLQAILGRLRKLDRLLLSWDRFHGSRGSERVRALSDWCARGGVAFSVSVAIAAPEDLAFAARLRRETGADVSFTRVEACGRAAQTGIRFEYPSFEERVLERRCPNLGTLTYIAGRGFSVCCANLAFNGHGPGFVHGDAGEHLASAFYGEVMARTFGEMLAARGLGTGGLDARHSSACGLCERIHAGNALNPA